MLNLRPLKERLDTEGLVARFVPRAIVPKLVLGSFFYTIEQPDKVPWLPETKLTPSSMYILQKKKKFR